MHLGKGGGVLQGGREERKVEQGCAEPAGCVCESVRVCECVCERDRERETYTEGFIWGPKGKLPLMNGNWGVD